MIVPLQQTSLIETIARHKILLTPETSLVVRLYQPAFEGHDKGLEFLGNLRPLITDGHRLWCLDARDRLLDIQLTSFVPHIPEGWQGNLDKTPASLDPASPEFLLRLKEVLL